MIDSKLPFVNESNEESDLSYKWLKKVKGILDNTGFSNVWLSDCCVQFDSLKKINLDVTIYLFKIGEVI